MIRKDKIVEGSGNVFEDLGFPDAEEHQTKAKLVSQIARIIEREGLTQSEVASRLGIDQPKISAMLKGRFRGFSVYRLMHFLAVLGHDVQIVTKDRSKRPMKVEHIAVQ